eukprot:GHVS01073444.1.p1 GENE.GHVS01073444.1~~GHVS01073444.1.p1  ORF type:complete len:429 (-),score=35.96 GHVS01073444.1:235-1521(-)
MRRTALITGITGQDGSYLAELLLSKGYHVHGLQRRSSSFNTERIDKIFDKITLHYGDLQDGSSLTGIVARVKPDEVYNLAAQSHVKVSFDVPEYTAETDGIGTLRLLEALRACQLDKTTRFYQAGTSEMFGAVRESPQTELTPFYPRSPYGAAKVYAHWIVTNYRESYSMFCCNGILFNHESPRRGKTFVTRKITQAVAHIMKGTQEKIVLGNLDAKRDWGHARDYVKAMWMMLQQDHPDDFVIATSEQYSVRDFVGLCFSYCGIPIVWTGHGMEERGIDGRTTSRTDERILVSVSPQYFRPAEVETLLGSPAKAERDLGWKAECDIYHLAYDMMNNDFAEVGVELGSFEKCMSKAGSILKDNPQYLHFPSLPMFAGISNCYIPKKDEGGLKKPHTNGVVKLPVASERGAGKCVSPISEGGVIQTAGL